MKIKIITLMIGMHNIKIYNNNNELIFDSTTYEEIVYFNANYGVYKIVITSVYGKLISSFIVYMNSSNTFIFSFKNHVKKVAFKITDSKYKDLKIMRGEIILWQNHM